MLAAVSGGIGAGIVVWAKAAMPNDEVAEDREPLASDEEDVAAFKADFAAGEDVLRRRRLLAGLAAGALVAFGAAAHRADPLIGASAWRRAQAHRLLGVVRGS